MPAGRWLSGVSRVVFRSSRKLGYNKTLVVPNDVSSLIVSLVFMSGTKNGGFCRTTSGHLQSCVCTIFVRRSSTVLSLYRCTVLPGCWLPFRLRVAIQRPVYSVRPPSVLPTTWSFASCHCLHHPPTRVYINSNLGGYIYPAFRSFKAIESASTADDTQW